MLCSLASGIGESQLRRIRELEDELGVTLLAFSCHDAEPADTSADQLTRIRDLEEQLGMALVAVEGRAA